MLTVALPQPLEERLRELAASTGRSVEECLTEAVTRFLMEREEQEDTEDARLIQERLRAWEEQGRPGISLEEFARSRGIGGMG